MLDKSLMKVSDLYSFRINKTYSNNQTIEITKPFYIRVIYDCNLDSVYSNPVLPDGLEQLSNQYIKVGNIPILFIN